MKDGNNVIARVADSHVPTRIMTSEVRRFLLRFQRLSVYKKLGLFCRLQRCSGSENGRRSPYPKS